MTTSGGWRVAVAAVGVVTGVAAGGPLLTWQAPATLESRLGALRESGKLPAIAGVVFASDRILTEAALGVRRLGSETAVTTGDLWHIGSITKSFTATLVGKYVERGVLSWSSSLGELIGDERAGAFGPVTIEQLLSHRAGLGPAAQTAMLAQRTSSLPVPDVRQQAVTAALKTAPAAAPGAAYQYSNAGYVVMGAVLEAKTGRAWEDLLRSEVLSPLGLTSAGFGAPGTPGEITQPRGHRQQPGGGLLPVEPGVFGDNPPLLGPAGTLHMTLADLARWGQAHLRGERGRDGVVTSATFRRLHRPPVEGADYALGWVVRVRDGRRTVWHNGSNTLWYAIVAFDPDADTGVAIATNGSIGAQKIVDPALAEVLGDWIGRRGR